MRWVGFVVHMGKVRNAYNILVRKPEGKGPLSMDGKVMLKFNLKGKGCEDVSWIHLAQNRV